METFSIDIGASAIKIAQIKKEGDQLRLTNLGLTKTPGVGLSSEADKDLLAIAEAIKKLKTESGITSLEVISSLSEANVITRVIDLPAMTEEEVGQALKWELEEVVPIPLDESNYDWQIVKKTNSALSVLVAVAPKTLVAKYLKIFEMAELKPVALETEVLALVRALKSVGTGKTKLIMDFGAKSVSSVACRDDEVILTRSVPLAGEAMTRSISTGFSLEQEVAEEYKKAYGLTGNELEGKIKDALQPVIKPVFDEIAKITEFIKEKRKEAIEMIVLSGGGANLPGLSEEVARQTGLDVQIANPLAAIKCDENLIKAVKDKSSSFTIVLGLAMREL